MTVTTPALDNMTLNIQEDIRVHAPLATTFAALLEQLGPANTGRDGKPLETRIEAWPGGRWYRDLGEGMGHPPTVERALVARGESPHCDEGSCEPRGKT